MLLLGVLTGVVIRYIDRYGVLIRCIDRVCEHGVLIVCSDKVY